MNRKRESYPENVPGDFYVEKSCCTMCGLPDAIAPELFAWNDPEFPQYCFIKKQPANDDELQRMIEVARDAELSCIRYCGKNRKIINQIPDVSDYPDEIQGNP